MVFMEKWGNEKIQLSFYTGVFYIAYTDFHYLKISDKLKLMELWFNNLWAWILTNPTPVSYC